MGYVFSSVAEALSFRYVDIQERTENNHAIYGTACYGTTLVTQEGFGVKPNLSGEIINESEKSTICTGKFGGSLGKYEGYHYSIQGKTFNYKSFDAATKDDLYLFGLMAHPDVLKNDELRSILGKRLSTIHQEELNKAGANVDKVREQQEIDEKKFMYIIDSVGKAVQGPGRCVYYAEGYQPEEFQNQPE